MCCCPKSQIVAGIDPGGARIDATGTSPNASANTSAAAAVKCPIDSGNTTLAARDQRPWPSNAALSINAESIDARASSARRMGTYKNRSAKPSATHSSGTLRNGSADVASICSDRIDTPRKEPGIASRKTLAMRTACERLSPRINTRSAAKPHASSTAAAANRTLSPSEAAPASNDTESALPLDTTPYRQASIGTATPSATPAYSAPIALFPERNPFGRLCPDGAAVCLSGDRKRMQNSAATATKGNAADAAAAFLPSAARSWTSTGKV